MVEEKGRQREKDPCYAGFGVPAKPGLGEEDHGRTGQRGLLPPRSQDLATWWGQMDTWFSSELSCVWFLLLADILTHVPVVFS